MGGLANINVEIPSTSFSEVAAHDSDIQGDWRNAYIQAATLARDSAFYQAAQAVIIAGIQAAAADYAADKQYDIANRQMEIAEAEYDRYLEHFICAEHKVAGEACDAEIYVPQYGTRANRSVVDIRRQFSLARQKMARSRSRYCLAGFEARLCDLEGQEAAAVAAAKDAGYRFEESEEKTLNELRWKHMLDSFNGGRGIMTGQSNMYSGAMQMAFGAYETRLSGINNFLGAVSGGISGVIAANQQLRMAQGVPPSPFTNSYAGYVSPSPYTTGYNFAYNGPSPLGAAASTGGLGGLS